MGLVHTAEQGDRAAAAKRIVALEHFRQRRLLEMLMPAVFVADLRLCTRVINMRQGVSILFCDVCVSEPEHTSGALVHRKLAEGASPATLVMVSERARTTPRSNSLVQLSMVFDTLEEITRAGGAHKVETIGSEFMAVSGLPAKAAQPGNTALVLVKVALEMLGAVRARAGMEMVRSRLRSLP